MSPILGDGLIPLLNKHPSPLSMGFLITLKGLSDASKAHSNVSTPKTIESCQLASAFTDNARGIKVTSSKDQREANASNKILKVSPTVNDEGVECEHG